jgi:hypothetical protein
MPCKTDQACHIPSLYIPKSRSDQISSLNRGRMIHFDYLGEPVATTLLEKTAERFPSPSLSNEPTITSSSVSKLLMFRASV